MTELRRIRIMPDDIAAWTLLRLSKAKAKAKLKLRIWLCLKLSSKET